MDKNTYSFYSHVYIKQSDFLKAVNILKTYYVYNLDIQDYDNLVDILKKLGWRVEKSYLGDISALHYSDNKWLFSAEIALKQIAHLIKPNSIIKFCDTFTNSYWSLTFDGKSMQRNKLHREFIDFNDKQQLLELFTKCTKNLLRLGESSERLKNMIFESFVYSVVD